MRAFLNLAARVVLVGLIMLPVASARAQEIPPDELITDYLAAFARGDLDALVNAHAENAIYMSPAGTWIGRDEIRERMQIAVDEFSDPNAIFEIYGLWSQGNMVLLTWVGESAGYVYSLAVETFIFENNEITYHSYAASVIPKN